MNNRLSKLQEKIPDFLENLSNQRYLQSIRYGISTILPFITIATLILFVSVRVLNQDSLDISLTNLSTHYFITAFNLIMSLAIFMFTFAMGSKLSQYYNLENYSIGWISVISILIVTVMLSENDLGNLSIIRNLMSFNLLYALILTVITVEIFRLFEFFKKKIKYRSEIPVMAVETLLNFIPYFASIIFVVSISKAFGNQTYAFIEQVTTILLSMTNSWIGMILPVLLITVFWTTGIHGASVVGMFLRPIWVMMLINNVTIQVQSFTGSVPFIITEPFYQWFVWIGGSGATLGLAILLFFRSKSESLKSLGKTSIIPSVFNINESIIFGAPIASNRTLMAPFVLAPVVTGSIAYVTLKLGYVNSAYILAPWTLPGPLGAYIATGGDVRAALLNILLILVSILIYYPFFRYFDKAMCAKELENSEQRSLDI